MIWLAVTIGLAAGFRFVRLGTKSFWLDEAESLMIAHLPWQQFLSALVHRQANMTLYYLLLRAWIHLGSGEFAVRSLSVLAGVIAIPAVYLLGKNLFGPKTGRLSALLLSCVAFHLRYSQEARSYSLLVLLAVFSTLFFLRSLRQPSRKNWAGYVLLSILTVYAQVFGYFVLLSQWVSLLWAKGSADRRAFLGCIVWINLLIAPLAFCLLVISDRSQLRWLGKPNLASFYHFWLDLTGNGGGAILLLCALLILVAVRSGKLPEHARNGLDSWNYPFLLIWLLLPVVALLILSARWPSFTPRFLIPGLVPMVLLVAEGINRMPSKLIGIGSLILVLASWVNADISYYRSRSDIQQSDNWRDATSYVLSRSKAGDAALFTYSEERLVFDEYQRMFHKANAPIQLFPGSSDLELLTERPSRPHDEMVERIADAYTRVWVISALRPDSASQHATALLARYFTGYIANNFGFVRVELFTK